MHFEFAGISLLGQVVGEAYLISHAFSCTTPHVHAFGGRSCASLSCSYNLLSHQLLYLGVTLFVAWSSLALRCTILFQLQHMFMHLVASNIYLIRILCQSTAKRCVQTASTRCVFKIYNVTRLAHLCIPYTRS